MSGFKTGSLSQLFLSRTLRAETSSKSNHSLTEGGGAEGLGGGKQKGTKSSSTPTKAKQEGWWTKNPHPVAAWALPEGKTFIDFFDSRSETLKQNLAGWPKLKHHDPATTKDKCLCVKYQCIGSCVPKCFLSHVDPEQMPEATKKAVEDKFKLIFG